MTPFEKNLSVWRELWRVIEKSDVVIQILDARNPLMFRCNDLEDYVRSLDGGKDILLLLNKSDYLTEEMRIKWSEYFINNKINCIFVSAKIEQNKLNDNIDNPKLEELINCMYYSFS